MSSSSSSTEVSTKQQQETGNAAVATTNATTTISENEAVQIARMRQGELEMIEKNILDLQSAIEEHKRVLKQITPLNGDRRCYRGVNGVLIEKTVATAIPDITLTMNKMGDQLNEIITIHNAKSSELKNFMTEHNIRFTTAEQAAAARAQAGAKSAPPSKA